MRYAIMILAVLILPACGSGGGDDDNGFGTPTAAGAGTGVGGLGRGPSPVDLGSAGTFVILAKSGVSTTGTTAIVGNLGLSPAAGSLFTGFSETLSGTFATSPLVTGQMFAADYLDPTPLNLGTAVLDMQDAYTEAAGRAPDYTELAAGDISGLNLGPATYKWSTGVLMSTSISLTGGPNDVWIFQIAQGLTVATGVHVILAGGALPQNIFWQVFGAADLGTGSNFKGVLVSQTSIVMRTGSSLSGRALAQTAVTLDAATVTSP
jgi:ice-binding like protein